MAVHAAFAAELGGFSNSDDRFLALLGQDSQFDSSFLNVKHRVGDVALLKHVLILMEFQYLLSGAHFGEKNLRVKHVISRLSHRSFLWFDERHLRHRRDHATSSSVARLRLIAFHTTRGVFAEKVA